MSQYDLIIHEIIDTTKNAATLVKLVHSLYWRNRRLFQISILLFLYIRRKHLHVFTCR